MPIVKDIPRKFGILVLSSAIYPEKVGGAEIHIFYTCNRLAEWRHRIFAISSATKFSGEASDSDILFVKISLRLWPTPFATLSYIVKSLIVSFNLRKQIDIVHAHIADFPMVVAFLFSLFSHKPYIVTCQGSDIRISSRKFLHRIFQASILRSADGIAAVSNEIAELLTRKYSIPRRKIVIVGNAYDDRITQELANIRLCTKAERSKRIICVANMRLEKDHMTLIKGFARLVTSMENKSIDNIQLLLVGDGPLRGRLEEFCAQRGLHNVKFLGMLPHRVVLENVAKSDIFILTSIEEGMPNVIIEALALGKPVIATMVGGIPEVVKDGFNGLLIPARSPKDVVKALYMLLNDEKLYSELSKNAAKSVCGHSWSGIASEYEWMYANSLNSS